MPFQRVHSGIRAGVGQREFARCPSSHKAGVRPPPLPEHPPGLLQTQGQTGRLLEELAVSHCLPSLRPILAPFYRENRLKEARSLSQPWRKLWRSLGSPAGAWGHSYRGLGPQSGGCGSPRLLCKDIGPPQEWRQLLQQSEKKKK